MIWEKSKRKIQISKNIREVDKIISNKELLQKEYIKRNENLPLENKIFSMRILSRIMEEEKEVLFKELAHLNKLLKPQNFIKYKKELEVKEDYLKILNASNKQEELDDLKIEFQKLFLEMIKINIKRAETKQEIEKIIYDFRYYLLLPYDFERTMNDIDELRKKIEEVGKSIINKAIEFKIIQNISFDENVNYEILKNIFTVRIIKLEDSYLKITKEKEKYFLQIFDENVFEEKVEISKPEKLDIKPNKKIKIWN